VGVNYIPLNRFMVELGGSMQLIKSRKNEMSGACSTCGMKGEVYTGFRCGNLREMPHLADPGVEWEDEIKRDLQEVGREDGLDCCGSG